MSHRSQLDEAIDKLAKDIPGLPVGYVLDGCADEDIGSGEAMRRLMADETMRGEREAA